MACLTCKQNIPEATIFHVLVGFIVRLAADKWIATDVHVRVRSRFAFSHHGPRAATA